MFALSVDPLEQHPVYHTQKDDQAGACVVFVGCVRRVNHDREVILLEYEGAEELAQNEFEKVVCEAMEKYALLDVRCLHRVGRLKPGDKAIWMSVEAEHRSPAFDACRYIIEELKHRLPIWKKEHYADGDSGWINAP